MTIRAPYALYLGDSSNALEIKTGRGIYQWRSDSVLGEIRARDHSQSAGARRISIAEAAAGGARTLILGLTNSGGNIKPQWLPDLLEALDCGLDIASGLHAKLSNIGALAVKARECKRQLIDLRQSKRQFQTGKGLPRSGKRLLTVGTDCAVGKMYSALAIYKAMVAAGIKTSFRATGQTGIFIAGDGVCIDAVVSDFISGAVEALAPANDKDHWDIIEGQGSLFNPSFAGVSLGLLHGAQADALVVCHEWGREKIKDLQGFSVPSLAECIERNIEAAKLTNANASLVGISINCRKISEPEALQKIDQLQMRFSVPCFDPMITGVSSLIGYLSKKNFL